MDLWEKLNHMESKIDRVLEEQRDATERIMELMADDQQALDAEIAKLQSTLTDVQSKNQAIIDKLRSVTPGLPAPNFASEIALLEEINTGLSGVGSADAAAVAPPSVTPPATVPTPVTGAPSPTNPPPNTVNSSGPSGPLPGTGVQGNPASGTPTSSNPTGSPVTGTPSPTDPSTQGAPAGSPAGTPSGTAA